MRLINGFMSGMLLVALAAGCADDAVQDDRTTLYARLGGEPGIRTVINDFVGRIVADPKVNGYFLNKSVDGARLIECLVKQVGNATGGPQAYPDPAAGCRDMKSSHVGLGISKLDFDDVVGHLVVALTGAGVSTGDIDAITGVLGPLAPDIVEDPGNNKTVYQRVGRKPAIATVIDAFVARVAGDARVNGFFAGIPGDPLRLSRLKTCLVRQVASIDGPVTYGAEVTSTADPGPTAQSPCLGMLESHRNLVNGTAPITIDDFNADVEDLVIVL